MKVINNISEMQSISDNLRRAGKKIGFVPTMGFLHDGHLSLIKESKINSDVTIVSIYVNPSQFGPNEDFEQYPRDFDSDEKLCKNAGVDIVFYPENQNMYSPQHLTTIGIKNLSNKLCGISRPNHFEGVTTIVAKLFNITKPHIAVFGQKDAQQCIIIKRMVSDLNFDIDIIIAPTIRENDGLALSSRNKYLSNMQRKEASKIYSALTNAKEKIDGGEKSASVIQNIIQESLQTIMDSKIDYLSIVNIENLEPIETIKKSSLIAVAVYIGKTRLIDNIIVN